MLLEDFELLNYRRRVTYSVLTESPNSCHTVAGQTTQVNNATDRFLHVCLMHQKHLDRTALRLGSLVSIHLFPNRLFITASL